jgi:mycothiol synthase
VKAIVVAPDRRRAGIGRRLVDAGLAIEARRGRPNLLLGIVPDDALATAFAVATGFGYHSTLWDLELPASRSVVQPVWPAGHVARPIDRARDLEGWVGLFNAAFADHATPLQLDLHAMAANFAEPTVEDADTLVVEDASGELVGFCAAEPQRTSEGGVEPRAEIWTIGVRRDRQGQGLGRQLLRWGVAYLRGLGVEQVELSVNARNPHALALYETEGFMRTATRDRWARPVPGL